MVYADPKTGRDAAIVIKVIVKRRINFIRLVVLFLKWACMVGDADICECVYVCMRVRWGSK